MEALSSNTIGLNIFTRVASILTQLQITHLKLLAHYIFTNLFALTNKTTKNKQNIPTTFYSFLFYFVFFCLKNKKNLKWIVHQTDAG